MPPPPPSTKTILRTYRTLYKTGLLAIRHSKPARYTLRNRLRSVFRTTPVSPPTPESVSRTIEFLENAARYRGLEHKVLRNLLVVWGTRDGAVPQQLRNGRDAHLRVEANEAFDTLVREFNRTMGTCI